MCVCWHSRCTVSIGSGTTPLLRQSMAAIVPVFRSRCHCWGWGSAGREKFACSKEYIIKILCTWNVIRGFAWTVWMVDVTVARFDFNERVFSYLHFLAPKTRSWTGTMQPIVLHTHILASWCFWGSFVWLITAITVRG